MTVFQERVVESIGVVLFPGMSDSENGIINMLIFPGLFSGGTRKCGAPSGVLLLPGHAE